MAAQTTSSAPGVWRLGIARFTTGLVSRISTDLLAAPGPLGKLPLGEIGGQVGGGLVGGTALAVWLFVGERKEPKL